MKYWGFVVAVLLLVALKTQAAFIEGLEDIPAMDGLTQVENGNLSFGNEEIRLVEAYFTSKTLKFYDVKAFYEATLPQLGWAKKNSGKRKSSFEREGEILEISEETPSPLIVRITVKSKN